VRRATGRWLIGCWDRCAPAPKACAHCWCVPMAGPPTCAVSALLRFSFQGSEVESRTTSRTRPYLAGKPKEETSMA
jgi:hypothetical protein